MVFTLDGIVKHRNSNGIAKYKIKDSFGTVKELTSKQVKTLISQGNIVDGLEIRSGKLFRVKDVNKYSTRKQKPIPGISYATGKTLEAFVTNNIALRFKPRKFILDIVNFCTDINYNKVMILHGIRRTGKTTSIIQTINILINSGIKSEDIIYITISGNNVRMEALVNFIEDSQAKYIFIDEITRVDDFYSQASVLSDILAVFKRIVITGTDSFVFPASLKTNLYGRADVIHSTLVPYKEYIDLFNVNPDNALDEYKLNGGTLLKSEFYNDDAVYKTLRAVVIQNIKNSIQRGTECDSTLSKLTDEQLMYLIFNYIFMATMPKDSSSVINDRKALNQKITDTLAQISGSSSYINDYKTYNIPKGAAKAVLEALYELDILGHIFNVTIESEDLKKQNTIELIAMIQALANETLSYNSQQGKSLGFSFENMIIANVIMWSRHSKCNVGFAKYIENGTQHEIDLIVQRSISYEKHNICIEIKHSNKVESSFAKHLTHPSLEKAVGNVDKRIIVYRGNTIYNRGIHYVNAHEFLMNLESWLS